MRMMRLFKNADSLSMKNENLLDGILFRNIFAKKIQKAGEIPTHPLFSHPFFCKTMLHWSIFNIRLVARRAHSYCWQNYAHGRCKASQMVFRAPYRDDTPRQTKDEPKFRRMSMCRSEARDKKKNFFTAMLVYLGFVLFSESIRLTGLHACV